jgi:hypothetical protein
LEKQNMPRQEEHEKPENLVEAPHEAEHEARSLQDEVDSNATLQGYAAMNKREASEEILQEAYREGEREEAERKANDKKD